MRKTFLFALPVLFVIALFCGCTYNLDDDSQNSFVFKFSCPKEITMKLGTIDQSNETASAPLYANFDLDECTLEYDKEIINYDINTGTITALKSGETKIKATAGQKTVSVNVVVQKAVYCSYLFCSASEKISLEDTAQLNVKTNQSYNMGIDYQSMDTSILTVDANGVITPLKSGTTSIKISAKTSINPSNSNGYSMTYTTTAVTVVEPRKELKIEILDSQKQPLSCSTDEFGVTNYNLISSNSKTPCYILKVSSDKSLKNAYITEETTSQDCTNVLGSSSRLWKFLENTQGYLIEDDVYLRPIYAVDCGVDYIQQGLLEVGLNYRSEIKSNLIKLNVYRVAQEGDISLTLYNDESCQNEYILKNNSNQYYLYENDAPKFLKTTVSPYCLKPISYVSDNVTCQQVEGGLLVSIGGQVGGGTITFYINDGSGYSITIHFYNDITSQVILVDCEDVVNISLNDGGVANFFAYYSVKNENGENALSQHCQICFVDENYQIVNYDEDTILYQDISTSTFTIDFLKTGQYRVCLASVMEGYLSKIITINVL